MTMTKPEIDPEIFFSEEHADDPYPTLKLLRDHYPVYRNPLTDTWMISRYDDVCAAFRDLENYSAQPNALGIGAVFGPTLMEYDGEQHNKLRNIVAPEFVGKKLEALLPIIERNSMALIEKYTEKHARRIAKEAAKTGRIDIVDDFATRLPLNVILDVLDLPQEAHDMFHEWYPAMMNGIGGPPDVRAAGIKANQEYHDYLEPLLQERSKNPKDDLISRLCVAVVDGHRMTFEEIKAFASLILVAGAETTDKAIANLWYEMLANPEQWELVRDDPSLLDRAFTEMMRVHGPSGGQSRRAIHDIPFPEYGVTIPEGAYVNLSIYGGNRDERVFANPDKFDVMRPDLYVGKALRAGYHDNGQASHLGFGLGKHFCVGYQLAQTETVIGSRMLMDVMRNPRFAPGSNPKPIAISLNPWELLIEFDPA